MGKLTTGEFIERARAVHGNIYDYSKTIYNNAVTKVTIIDPEYGEFEQLPFNHLSGKGNMKRSLKNSSLKATSTTEKFIKKAREVHGNIYDYSKVVYVSSIENVTIIDPVFGEFLQTPSSHLSGRGNMKRAIAEKNKITTSLKNDFIKQAKQVHNIEYDYSKVLYVNKRTKVTIIDPEYGEFEQTPEKHLKGNINRKRLGIEKLTTEEFIKRAKMVHGNIFNYEKTVYVNMQKEVIITDPNIGDCLQTPYNHLNGHVPLATHSNLTDRLHLDHIIPISLISKHSDRNKVIKTPIGKLFNIEQNLIRISCAENYKKSDNIILFGETIKARCHRGEIDLIRYLFKRTFDLDIEITDTTCEVKQLKLLFFKEIL